MTDGTRVELAKWFEEVTMPDTAKARLFGELVKIAAPFVERYHSDLYRDAIHLQNVVACNGDWFYYCVDDCGTHIGNSDVILEFRKDAQYRVTITHEDNVWYATFENITPHRDCTGKWCEEAHEPNSRCPKNTL